MTGPRQQTQRQIDAGEFARCYPNSYTQVAQINRLAYLMWQGRRRTFSLGDTTSRHRVTISHTDSSALRIADGRETNRQKYYLVNSEQSAISGYRTSAELLAYINAYSRSNADFFFDRWNARINESYNGLVELFPNTQKTSLGLRDLTALFIAARARVASLFSTLDSQIARNIDRCITVATPSTEIITPCPDGQKRNEAGNCVADTTTVAPCATGFVRDERGICVRFVAPPTQPRTPTTPTPTTPTTPTVVPCASGQERVSGRCVPVCPEGQFRQDDGSCQAPPQEDVTCPDMMSPATGADNPPVAQSIKYRENGNCVYNWFQRCAQRAGFTGVRTASTGVCVYTAVTVAPTTPECAPPNCTPASCAGVARRITGLDEDGNCPSGYVWNASQLCQCVAVEGQAGTTTQTAPSGSPVPHNAIVFAPTRRRPGYNISIVEMRFNVRSGYKDIDIAGYDTIVYDPGAGVNQPTRSSTIANLAAAESVPAAVSSNINLVTRPMGNLFGDTILAGGTLDSYATNTGYWQAWVGALECRMIVDEADRSSVIVRITYNPLRVRYSSNDPGAPQDGDGNPLGIPDAAAYMSDLQLALKYISESPALTGSNNLFPAQDWYGPNELEIPDWAPDLATASGIALKLSGSAATSTRGGLLPHPKVSSEMDSWQPTMPARIQVQDLEPAHAHKVQTEQDNLNVKHNVIAMWKTVSWKHDDTIQYEVDSIETYPTTEDTVWTIGESRIGVDTVIG